MKDVLVTMAGTGAAAGAGTGDAYCVKAALCEQPVQVHVHRSSRGRAQQEVICCRACKYCWCGVALTLVLASLALVAVVGLTFHFGQQLEELRAQLYGVEQRVKLKQDVVEQLRAFEMGMDDATLTDPPDVEDEEDIDDHLDPPYPEDEDDYAFPVEAKVSAPREDDVEPLLPAGGPEIQHFLVRRAITPVRARDPQLQLYHTLQTASPYREAEAEGQYAERPAPSYVTPPSWPEQQPVTNRRSRVMDAKHRARHQHQQHRYHAQRLLAAQDAVEVPQDVGRDPARSVESIDATVEVGQTWRPYNAVVEGPAIAAHFVADSSRHRSSHHFDGNGRLKHPNGDYGDWRPSPWVQDLGLDQHFRLAETGAGSSGSSVVVDTPGLYLVYAQVNYANEKDENGFWLYRNGQKELLCVITGSGASSARANTCFTAGVLRLAQGDRVTLRDLAGDRYRVLDHAGRSYIGLVHLQGCKLKTEQPSRVTQGQ